MLVPPRGAGRRGARRHCQDDDRPGHGAGETQRVAVERLLDFREHLRGAGGGVDAPHLGLDHRGGDLEAIDFPEDRFLVLILAGELLDQFARHCLLEGRFGPGAVVVIDAFDGHAVRALAGEIIRPRHGPPWQQQQQRRHRQSADAAGIPPQGFRLPVPGLHGR